MPSDDVEACTASHARLLALVEGADVRAPSRLPGWSVAHVLTHLARNADSVVRRLQAAVDGQLVAQYDGGAEGRAADIEAGARRSGSEVVADLADACRRVEDCFRELPEAVWAGEVLAGSGPKRVPAARLPYARWREVEIHLVDLGLGYEPVQWPPALVERLLPELLEGLPGRADHAVLAAWALGRGPAPDLASWG